MAFEPLRTDYKDAVWAGLRKYLMLKNEDDTVSLKDVTQYTVYDDAFFGAEDANRINAAINAIMASVEKGTDLYEAFTAFFENQKKAFTAEADKQNEDFGKYLDGLEQTADADIAKMKDDYTAEIKNFESTQEAVYNTWFDHIKDQLSDDAAGNLQAQIDNDVFKSYRGILENIDTAPKDVKSGCYAVFSSGVIYDLLLCFNSKQGSATALQVLLSFDLKKCKIRPAINNGSWGPWRPLAFADNVAEQLTPMQETLAEHDELVEDIKNYSTLCTTNEAYLYSGGKSYDFLVRGSNYVLATADGIYLSTDFGKTWSKAVDATLKHLKVSIGGNKPRLTAAGDGGVYYSDDNGITWTMSELKTKIVDMNRDAGYPILAIDKSNLYRSEPNGSMDIWETIQMPSTFEKETDELLCVLYHRKGYLLGSKQKLYRVSGTKISAVDCNVNGPFLDMDKTLNVIYACIGENTRNLYHSEDDGVTWTVYNTPDIQFTGVSVQNESLICAYNETQICVSVNGGATWKTLERAGIHRVTLMKNSIRVLNDNGCSVINFQYEAGGLPAVVDDIYTRSLSFEPNSDTVTIGSVTAADSVTISGKAKKITLLVKKVTATATTGAAIYQYINLPTTEDGVTAPKLSALTAAISTSHGTIAVSGSDILLKSVKGFSITAIIDYKNY